VSDKYKFVSTMRYLEPFTNRGWDVVKTVGEGGQYGQHIVTLRHPEFKLPNNDFVQLMVVNSHDRSRAFSVHGGIFRLICENGLVVGEDFESFRFRHIGSQIYEKLENSYEKIAAKLNEITGKVDRLQTFQMEWDQEVKVVYNIADRLFAKDTAKTKVEVSNIRDIEVKGTLRHLRPGDEGKDGYTVLNKVQENIIRRRGLKVLTKETNKETKEVQYKSHNIRSSENTVRGHNINNIITHEFLKLVA